MDDHRLPVSTPVIGAAYLLAVLSLFVPLAVVGSTFAGAVLWQRDLRAHSIAVMALGFACMIVGVTALR